MDPRYQDIFSKLVEEVIETGEPVGSKYMVEKYNLDISPATLRNYFAQLEKEEYIIQPHTSSGRLPTEKGYKYYVHHILPKRILSRKEKTIINKVLDEIDSTNNTKNLKKIAKAFAEIAQNAVIVATGDADSYYTGLSYLFAQPEFKDWNKIITMSDVLDKLDDVLLKLRQNNFSNPTVLIGKDCPFGPLGGLIVLSLQNNLIGILGPMRMDYGLSIALLNQLDSFK